MVNSWTIRDDNARSIREISEIRGEIHGQFMIIRDDAVSRMVTNVHELFMNSVAYNVAV